MAKLKYLLGFVMFFAASAFAGEADIQLPELEQVKFFHGAVTGHTILYFGLFVCAVGAVFGLLEYLRTRALPVHRSMGDVSQIIWETCKTYLFQQGKFLAALWLLIAVCMIYYFIGLQGKTVRPGDRDSCVLRLWHPRQLRRGVVRHPHQHHRQQPRGVRLAARQSAENEQTEALFRWLNTINQPVYVTDRLLLNSRRPPSFRHSPAGSWPWPYRVSRATTCCGSDRNSAAPCAGPGIRPSPSRWVRSAHA